MSGIKKYACAYLFYLSICSCYADKHYFDDDISALTTADLRAMSLEQVMELNITTSVSKKQQKVKDSAAAIFVISAEDIRRSGATNIPEALRMAPGLEVARINANQWAITVRGMNDRTANKLLVLMDGRTLFSPGFSGTLWETLDMLMDNIERIEVIRGPGATLWGANAVNGIINIISKNAKKTQGVELRMAGGDEQLFGSARYGFQIDEHSYGRVHFQSKKHDSYRTTRGSDGYDGWETQQGGVQLNLSDGDNDAVTLQSNFFRGRLKDQSPRPYLTAPYIDDVRSQNDSVMFSLLSRWDKTLSANSDFSVRAYYDYQQHEFYLPFNFHQFDLDFQHHLKLFSRHELIWGAGYRLIQDQYNNNAYYQFHPDSRNYQLFNGFLQDEITLIQDRLKFVIGSKLEHNDFSGLQFLPNVRLIWSPNIRHRVWAAVSKAATTPARTKDELDIWLTTIQPSAGTNNLPVQVLGLASLTPEHYKSEEVIAYETGYHFQASKVSADVALFYNNYKRLPWLYPVSPVSKTGAPYIVQPLALSNGSSGYTYGFELSGSWQATDFWKLNLSYSFFEERYKGLDGRLKLSTYGTPQNQFSLRSSFDISDNLELDFWLRYVDKLADVNEKPVPQYTSLNLRLAYKPLKNLEFSLVGDNLIEPHIEFNPDLQLGNYDRTVLERRFYVQTRLNF